MNTRTAHISRPLTAAGAINFHINRACDSRCTFCFATFREVPGQLSRDAGFRVIAALREAGGQKLNFAGGEPTLHRHIAAYMGFAKSLGFVTSVITNGFRLGQLLDAAEDAIDWVGLSCDSADEAIQRRLGRGQGDHVRRTVGLAARLHAAGIRVKMNTVVTQLTWAEDMTGLLKRVRPERWKVFQVLPVEGQNDGRVEPLLISSEQFQSFVKRHGRPQALPTGVTFVAEDNAAMTDSYVMVDPSGRLTGNSAGRTVTSAPLLEVGIEAGLRQVGFDVHRLLKRGGRYSW